MLLKPGKSIVRICVALLMVYASSLLGYTFTSGYSASLILLLPVWPLVYSVKSFLPLVYIVILVCMLVTSEFVDRSLRHKYYVLCIAAIIHSVIAILGGLFLCYYYGAHFVIPG